MVLACGVYMYEHMNKSKLNKKGLPKKNFYFFLKRLQGREAFVRKGGMRLRDPRY